MCCFHFAQFCTRRRTYIHVYIYNRTGRAYLWGAEMLIWAVARSTKLPVILGAICCSAGDWSELAQPFMWRCVLWSIGAVPHVTQSHTWRSPTRDANLHVTQTYTRRSLNHDSYKIYIHWVRRDPPHTHLVCTSSILNTCSDLELTRTRQCKLNYGWLLGGRRASELIHIRCLEWV